MSIDNGIAAITCPWFAQDFASRLKVLPRWMRSPAGFVRPPEDLVTLENGGAARFIK